jgi:hypothetical protein
VRQATVTEVSQLPTDDASIRLEAVVGDCPRWLVMRRPPQHFEAIVGTTLEIKSGGGVYVAGKLWARRMPRYPHEIVLIARGQ